MRLEEPNMRDQRNMWQLLVRVINGKLGFGDGIHKSNIDGNWVQYQTAASPNSIDTVPHGLKRKPAGYMVMAIDKPGVVYMDAPADTVNLYLKCSAGSAVIRLFVI